MVTFGLIGLSTIDNYGNKILVTSMLPILLFMIFKISLLF